MKIRKAIIPAAGLGTRVLPASKSIPKEMLNIVDKPAIQYIVEEAVEAGIEEILIITNRGKGAIEDHFDHSFELEANLRDNPAKKRIYDDILKPVHMANIYFLRQKETNGLADAIAKARGFIGNEPFAILYGDDVIMNDEYPVVKQLCDAYEKYGKGVCGVHGILAGHCIDNKQNFRRIDCFFYIAQLVHELLVYVQASCRIEKHKVVAVLFGVLDRSLCDIHRICRAHLEHRDIKLFADGLKLLDGSGTVDVARSEQRAFALLADVAGKLCAVCRLTCALKADEHYDARRLRADGQALIFAAHKLYELFVYYFDHLLSRRKRFEHIRTRGTLRYAFGKFLNDLVAYVGLEKRHAHFLHGFLDVGRGQSALAAQLFKGSGQLIGQ